MKAVATPRMMFGGILVVALGLGLTDASAQQQQWASQYVSWAVDTSATDIYNIDQQVWIAAPNTASFWPLQWSWLDGEGVGGYLGLLQEGDGTQYVRFSLWDAKEAWGTQCRPFGGEGTGYTCVLPVTINPDAFYRLRLYRTAAVSDGQWWGGWLIEADEDHGLIEHVIGQIKVAPAYSAVASASISNFVEYFGTVVSHCDEVPPSVIGFAPPSVNYQGAGTGVYGGSSTYRGSARAGGNPCESGREGRGAFVTATPYDFGRESGVMLFLGGSREGHTLRAQDRPPPPTLPDN